MAIRVDRPRFRGIFGRMRVEAPPAEEFLDAFEDSLNDAQDGLASLRDVDVMKTEIIAEMRAMEARYARSQVVTVTVILTEIAIATAILLGLLL